MKLLLTIKNKKEKKKKVIFKVVKKQTGEINVYITKEGVLKEIASGLSTKSFLDLYFTNLVENITTETTKEQVLNKYEEVWKNKGIYVVYIDSWGHKWNNQMPSKTKIDDYLSKYIKDGIDKE